MYMTGTDLSASSGHFLPAMYRLTAHFRCSCELMWLSLLSRVQCVYRKQLYWELVQAGLGWEADQMGWTCVRGAVW